MNMSSYCGFQLIQEFNNAWLAAFLLRDLCGHKGLHSLLIVASFARHPRLYVKRSHFEARRTQRDCSHRMMAWRYVLVWSSIHSHLYYLLDLALKPTG